MSAIMVTPVAMASATDAPAASACFPAQLHLTLNVTKTSVHYGGARPHTVYLTNVNAYAKNTGGVPCYLAGDPHARLMKNGRPLRLRYHRGKWARPAAETANFIVYPGQINDDVLGWSGRYCGRKLRAAIQIPLVTGSLTSRPVIPSPPCLGSGRTGVDTSAWYALPD